MPGLTTQVDIIIHGTYVYRAVGRDRLPYVSEHWVLDHRFTNVANGKYVTINVDLWENDILVKDNRDGTNTGLNAGTVYSEMHDASGRKLAYESNWTLSRWVKDNGGTPRDPGDDEWLDWVVLREGGHVADYCAATVAAVSDPSRHHGPRPPQLAHPRPAAPLPPTDRPLAGRRTMHQLTVTLAALAMAIVPLGGVPTSPSLASAPYLARGAPDAGRPRELRPARRLWLPGERGGLRRQVLRGHPVRPDVPR